MAQAQLGVYNINDTTGAVRRDILVAVHTLCFPLGGYVLMIDVLLGGLKATSGHRNG